MILTRIRELRLEKGLTIKVLATELNIKESTLSKYERGEREPSIEALVLLSEFFDVSVDYLVFTFLSNTVSKIRWHEKREPKYKDTIVWNTRYD